MINPIFEIRIHPFPLVLIIGIAGDILIARVNRLLIAVGINAPPVTSLAELRQSASSIFVAVFEAIFVGVSLDLTAVGDI